MLADQSLCVPGFSALIAHASYSLETIITISTYSQMCHSPRTFPGHVVLQLKIMHCVLRDVDNYTASTSSYDKEREMKEDEDWRILEWLSTDTV